MDLYVFEASLVYRMSSKKAVTQKNPVLTQKKKLIKPLLVENEQNCKYLGELLYCLPHQLLLG